MIRVQAGPGSLAIHGHAGAGPRGADIVCAAVSILAETLAASLPPEDSVLEPGRAEFRFSPGNPAAAFTLRGLELLAKNRPDAVFISKK